MYNEINQDIFDSNKVKLKKNSVAKDIPIYDNYCFKLPLWVYHHCGG